MKNLETAVRVADNMLSKHGERFVVLSPDEMDITGNDYHVTDECGLDTFFHGCTVLYSNLDGYLN